ncbi:hypothetical protein J4450_06130 [Candidatus Micrarchaeota archaeon]|nr:hypothetical protein [Candidatus Micrarchaeota archaeon]
MCGGSDKCCGSGSCGDACGGGSCGSDKCGEGTHCESEKCEPPKMSPEQMFDMFVCLADAAWMKALKQKMVETYLKKHGKDMDKMAEFFTEAAGLKWMNYEEFQKKRPELIKKFMEEEEKHKKK